MYYEKIKDPTRVHAGDVIVIPASKAKGLALTPSALSRYGVSHGFTSRSLNRTGRLTEMFTKPLSEGRAVAFVVSETTTPYVFDKTSTEMRSFFDIDNKDSSSTPPEQRVISAELVPINVGTVLNGEPLVSKEDTAAAAFIASPNISRIVSRAASRLILIGKDLCIKDLVLTGCYPNFSADETAAKIREILNREGRVEKSEDSTFYMPSSNEVLDDFSTKDTLKGSRLAKNMDKTLSLIYGYRGGNNSRVALGRSAKITFTADALQLLAKKGAVFLRPTERMRGTILDRLLQWISEQMRKHSNSVSFSVSDVTAAAKKAIARVKERTSSWDARVKKTTKSADRNMSGISKETKGII